jgi:DNA-binding SARP family transcriptional activator
MLRLQLLGAPAIYDDDHPVPLPSQKAQALLFLLAAEAERSFARGQLIALLWEESAEKEGRNSLSTVLSRLRQALPVFPLRAAGDTLGWNPDAQTEVDVLTFQALTRPARGMAAIAQRLEQALALVRGSFLDGFAVRDSASYDEWLQLERERWQQRVLNLLDQLVAHYEAERAWPLALDHARRAVALDPLQERFHRALMRVYALAGDRAAALAQYRACAEVLERELGVEPDPETVALDQQIRAGRLTAPHRAAEQHTARVVNDVPSPPLVTPPARLGARLDSARRRAFVGRRAELELFREALANDEPPFTLLHMSGPGGVGKSTLLAAFARLAAEAGVLVIALDGRSVQPTPDGFLAALREQTGVEQPLDALPERALLLVDTYELLMPIESWLRDTLLPQLPARAIVVLAGRTPPSAGWRADVGWQQISRSVRLDNLDRADATDYLERLAIPAEHHKAVLGFTHGFPLGLSLAAEVIMQHPRDHFDGMASPDIVQALLARFLDGVPSVAHRAALEAASQVRALSEPLLARELFDWLRGLSFVSHGRRGLFPHDLAREALAADLRWRNPPWYRELHERARDYYSGVFARSGRAEQQQVLLDLIFLHDNPLMRSLFSWSDIGGLSEDTPRAADWPELLTMVRRHEGDEAAGIAERWFRRQPEGVTVFRDAGGVAGFNAIITVRPGDDAGGDPCVAAALHFLAGRPALAEGQYLAIDRFWMERAAYQGVSAAQGLIFVAATRYVLTAPGLAYSFHVFADPEFWAPAVDQVHFSRLPEATFVVGGRSYGVFFHDWLAEPPAHWLAALAEIEVRA